MQGNISTTRQSMVGYAGRDRFLALWLDNAFAILAGFAATTLLPETGVRWVALLLVYFGYFFMFEALWSRTPSKALFGLRVIMADGARVTAKAAALRTTARFVEANPLLFGALPGAIFLLASDRKQRLGDVLGSTLVVKSQSLSRTT
jgi:uncharacterized RDD family membrane protein YckC